MSLLWESFTWLQCCNECIERLEEHTRPQLSIGNRQSLVARIARLEGAKTRLQRCFIHFGSDYTDTNSSERLVWREIDIAFENLILTGAVINDDYIEPQQFLKDAGCARTIARRYRETQRCLSITSIKVNTVNLWQVINVLIKSIKNCELFQTLNLHEWYEHHVIEPTLAVFEEFQERDSGWVLSRILDLT